MESAPGTNGDHPPTSTETLPGLPPHVIVPPKEQRNFLERNAEYVARNGPAFEKRIIEKHINDPKFAFLKPDDIYHPYYNWRIEEYQAGRTHGGAAGGTKEAQPIAPQKPKGPEPPPEFQFSARMPNISALDLDVVKLTAQHVAKNGRSWMTALSQRESGNPQFDFLRPQHSLNQFFNRMVDQYSDLINSRGTQKETDRVEELRRNVKDRFHILGGAKQRAEYTRAQERQKQKKEEESEAERLAYAQIDWHDFSVVETINFTEADEDAYLPPPTTLNDLQSASLEDRALNQVSHDRRIEETMPGEELPPQQQQQYITPQSLPPRPQAAPSPVNLPPRPSPGPPQPVFSPPPPMSPSSAPAPAYHPTASHPSGMNIRTDYVPRAAKGRQNAGTAICPNCKQAIPYNELDEHMRIELLDPRWKEQRAKAESRNATTNLSTADVANNLKRLASQRSDVFDDVRGGAGGLSEEEAKRRRKAATGYDGVISGDGHKGGYANPEDPSAQGKMQQMQNMTLDEQIRRIQEKAKGGQ